jgi:hypothetical protein
MFPPFQDLQLSRRLETNKNTDIWDITHRQYREIWDGDEGKGSVCRKNACGNVPEFHEEHGFLIRNSTHVVSIF